MRRLRTSVSARKDTFAFSICTITCGSSTPGVPRAKASATSVARCWLWLTWSIPWRSRVAKSVGALPCAAAGCGALGRTWVDRERIWARTRSISNWLMLGSSGCRDVDAGLAQPRELVAQGARTDAEPLRRLAPAPLVVAQRIEDEIALGLHQRAGERADRIRAGGVRLRRLVGELELNVLRPDDRPVEQDQRALQQVVQLAHVSRPGIGEEQVGRLGAQCRNGRSRPAARGQELHRER